MLRAHETIEVLAVLRLTCSMNQTLVGWSSRALNPPHMDNREMQNVFKYILIAVAAGVVSYIGLTIYGEGTRTAAASMASSVQLAQAQADNMTAALTSVSAVGNASTNQIAAQPGQGSSQGPAAKIIAPVEVSEIANLDMLLIQWRPRYESAKLAHAKFDASIANAKGRAAGYFAQQRALTGSMQSPENRARAEKEDEAETLLYRQWAAQADAALRKAAEIMIQLDDMDANLKKMELRADFVFDTSAFVEVPQAIGELNQQLADFQVSSENIKAVAGSPFEAGQ